MNSEFWTAIGTIALALIAIVTIYFQTKSFKLTLAADLSMRLEDKFNRGEFKKIRSKAARALKFHVDEEEAEDVFDFFETIGLFVRRGALDAEVVHNLFFHWINIYWTVGNDHISKRQQESRLLWKDFGDLYQKVLKIEIEGDNSSQDISLSTEDLEKYLNDEIELSS